MIWYHFSVNYLKKKSKISLKKIIISKWKQVRKNVNIKLTIVSHTICVNVRSLLLSIGQIVNRYNVE